MKKLAAILCLTMVVTSAALAQSDAEKDAYSQKTFEKMRQIDLLYNILPLLLTKTQIKELLPALDKARSGIRGIRDTEYKNFHEYADIIDASITKAVQDNILPTRDDRAKLTRFLIALDGRRQAQVLVNVRAVKEAFDKVITPAQRKAAINSLIPTYFEPDLKPEELTDDKKEEIYVREILLDPQTRPLLERILLEMKEEK